MSISVEQQAGKTEAAYADPLECFYELADTRAYLWSHFEYELPEAVDVLQAHAVRSGLVQLIGPDAVQGIMAHAFRPYRGAEHG
jgi:hypothetical protein